MNRMGPVEIRGLAKLWLIVSSYTEAAVLVQASPVKRNVQWCILLKIKNKWIVENRVRKMLFLHSFFASEIFIISSVRFHWMISIMYE